MSLKSFKAQAAITDAIVLLLITTFSVTLLFSFVGNWGNDQQTVLRSAYVVNYMQSVTKTMYYVDASTRKEIGSDGIYVYKYALKHDGTFTDDSTTPPAYDLDEEKGCQILEDYPGTLRVTDLLKRDLADSEPGDADAPAMPVLDDKFGDAEVPGRTAMRCAIKELMKPFAFSGYKYYMDVMLSEARGDYNPVDDPDEALVRYKGPEITNSKDVKVAGAEDGSDPEGSEKQSTANGGSVPGCSAVTKNAGYDAISVASPFQVLYSKKRGSAGSEFLDSRFVKYKTRICIWQAKGSDS